MTMRRRAMEPFEVTAQGVALNVIAAINEVCPAQWPAINQAAVRLLHEQMHAHYSPGPISKETHHGE